MDTVREASRRLPVRDSYDVVVVGGGVAGVAAALAAARSGASVALLERQFALGGLATLGNVLVYLPLCDGFGKQVVGGLGEELLKLSIRDGYDRIPEPWTRESTVEERSEKRLRVDFNPASFMLALEELVLGTGISLWYDTRFCEVVKRRGRIAAVVVENKDGRSAIGCRTVIDATGDADVCVRAGEPTVSLGGNVRAGWTLYSLGGEVKVFPCSDRYDPMGIDPPGDQPRYHGDVAAEVTRQTIDSRLLLVERLEKVRTAHPDKPVYPVALSQVPGFRMTRRLEGATVLEEAHQAQLLSDRVGLIGDWRKPAWYSIPYSSLIGVTTPNLITAGRCISSASAWDVTRAIPGCVVSGEAAGTAAAMLCQGRAASFARLSVRQLQLRLRRNGVIL